MRAQEGEELLCKWHIFGQAAAHFLSIGSNAVEDENLRAAATVRT
jgi:hypothetical protein